MRKIALVIMALVIAGILVRAYSMYVDRGGTAPFAANDPNEYLVHGSNELPDGWSVQKSSNGEYRWCDPNGITDCFEYKTYTKACEWARSQHGFRVRKTNTTWEACEASK